MYFFSLSLLLCKGCLHSLLCPDYTVLLAGYTLQCKYKGLQNTNTQIRASFSESGDFIICGSDDGSVYFWSTKTGSESEASPVETSSAASQEKSGSYEHFHAHSDIATVAIFAPHGARRSLKLQSPRASDKVRLLNLTLFLC